MVGVLNELNVWIDGHGLIVGDILGIYVGVPVGVIDGIFVRRLKEIVGVFEGDVDGYFDILHLLLYLLNLSMHFMFDNIIFYMRRLIFFDNSNL